MLQDKGLNILSQYPYIFLVYSIDLQLLYTLNTFMHIQFNIFIITNKKKRITYIPIIHVEHKSHNVNKRGSFITPFQYKNLIHHTVHK
jgi:hypothetical protein